MTENKGEKCSFVDEDKNTVLHYAAAKGDVEKVKKVIDDGHKVDPKNYLGWTPLMMAVRNGHTEVAKILLKRRANSTLSNKFGFDVFLMAIANGKLNLLHIILQHLLTGGISKQSLEATFSPVSLAVLFNHMHLVQFLVENSFNINASVPDTGFTPILFATILSNREIYDYLLANGADVKLNSEQKGLATVFLKPRNEFRPCLQHVPPPLMFVNSPALSPIQSPFTHFVTNVTPIVQMTRRSSGFSTPTFIISDVSPIPPPPPPIGFVSQVFFPPDFSPSKFVSPTHCYQHSDVLNSTVGTSFYPIIIPANSPCFNVY